MGPTTELLKSTGSAFRTNKSSLYDASPMSVADDDRQSLSNVALRVMRVRSGSTSGLLAQPSQPSPFERFQLIPQQQQLQQQQHHQQLQPHSQPALIPTQSLIRREFRARSPSRQMRHSLSGMPPASGRAGLAPYSSYSQEDATSAVAAAVGIGGSSASSSGASAAVAAVSGRVAAGTNTQTRLMLPRASFGRAFEDVGEGGRTADRQTGGSSPGRLLVHSALRGPPFGPAITTASADATPFTAAVASPHLSLTPVRMSAFSSPGSLPDSDAAATAAAIDAAIDAAAATARVHSQSQSQVLRPSGSGGGGTVFILPSGSGGGSISNQAADVATVGPLVGSALPVPPQEPSTIARRPSFRARSTTGVIMPSPPASPVRLSAPNAPAPPPGVASPGRRRLAPPGPHRGSGSDIVVGAVSFSGSRAATASDGDGGSSSVSGGGGGARSAGPNSPLLRTVPSLRSRLSAVSEGALLSATRGAKAAQVAALAAEVDAEVSDEDDDGERAALAATAAPSGGSGGGTVAGLLQSSSLRPRSHASSGRFVSFATGAGGDGKDGTASGSSGGGGSYRGGGEAPSLLRGTASARLRSAFAGAAGVAAAPVWAWDGCVADGLGAAAAVVPSASGLCSDGDDDECDGAASAAVGEKGPLDWLLGSRAAEDLLSAAVAAQGEAEAAKQAAAPLLRRQHAVSAGGASPSGGSGSGEDGEVGGEGKSAAAAAAGGARGTCGANGINRTRSMTAVPLPLSSGDGGSGGSRTADLFRDAAAYLNRENHEDLMDPVLDGIDPGRQQARRSLQRLRISLNGGSLGRNMTGRHRLLMNMNGAGEVPPSAAAGTSASCAAASSLTAPGSGGGAAGSSGGGDSSGGGGSSGGGSGTHPPAALAALVDQALKLPCVGLEKLQDPEKRLKVIQRLEGAVADGPASIARVLSSLRPSAGRWCR